MLARPPARRSAVGTTPQVVIAAMVPDGTAAGTMIRESRGSCIRTDLKHGKMHDLEARKDGHY